VGTEGGTGDSARALVGRAREVDQLEAALNEATRGPGRAVLLMGEPGIGKTRLCDEVAARAARRGLTVLWGRSWEAGGAPAYWPWLDVLAGLARGLDEASLRAALGEGASLLAELVPEIRAALPNLVPLPSPPSEEARFRLWRAVVGLIRRAGEGGGLVLIFDDLHAADRSSLALLYAVCREIRATRALLVATCRDVEARLDAEAGALIARIGREALTLSVARLDRAAANELLRHRAGVLDDAALTRLYERAQGNPLFLGELARLFVEEGAAAAGGGPVPAGVREVLRQRLDRVSPDARALLDVLAVGGDEVRPALAAAAAGRDAAWVRARVDEAVRVGVLADRGGHLRFSHALVREVLYRDLDADARRGLHAAFGAALERLAPAAAAAPLMELAHHALEGPAAELGRAVELAEGAARRALEVVAHEEAVDVLSRALAAVDAAGGAPAWRARLLLALGEARIRAGASAAGQALCREAAALARGLGDAELLARVALAYGRVFKFGEVDLVLVGMLEEALEALPPGDGASRARLLARLGGALQPAVQTDEPVRVAREAIATARRLGDRRVLLETMFDGMSALMDVVDPRERLDLNLEIEGLAVAQDDRERLLRTHLRLAIDHLGLGHLELADERIDAFDALARALRAGYALWRAPLLRALRAGMHGRFAEAEDLLAQAAALAEELRDPQRERALVLMREGLCRAAERHEDMLAQEGPSRRQRSSYRNGIAWQALGSALTYARLEDVARTREELALIPAELMPPADNVFAFFAGAEAIALAGSDELVARFRDLLEPYADQYAMLGMTALQWEGPVPRLLALLEARLGRWEQAEAHFEEATARARRLDVRPQLARVQYEHGRALLGRGRPADVGRGRALVEAARALAEELGMSGLARLAGARLQELPAVAAPAPQAPAPAAPLLSLVLEGEFWTLATAEAPALRLKDSLGLRYLARLIAEPSREIHVLELVGGGAGADVDGAVADAGDAGELLDDEARDQYRRRLEDLREGLAEAESFGDAARAARARAEIEALAGELSRAVGLGGRARRAGGAAERARSAVQRRIKNALQRIGEADAGLESRLSKAVRTGNYCVFRPEAF
jgi:hypothetical protein